MTRQQKIILAILAVLDLVVIAAMGTVAVTTTRRARLLRQGQLAGLAVGADPCVATILDALSEPGGTAIADWTPEAARIDISPAAPPADAPPSELLWDLIDRLPADLETHCPIPTTVTLAVHTRGPRAQAQTAVLAGTTLMDWLRGDLSDDALAAATRYRVASAAAP